MEYLYKRPETQLVSFKHILSFDCAHKSLAYFSGKFNVKAMSNLAQLKNDLFENFAAKNTLFDKQNEKDKQIISTIAQIKFLTDTFVSNINCGVLDVLNGKKLSETTSTERAMCLKNKLDKIFEEAIPDLVLIEDQPPDKNKKSTTVQDQICLYFCVKNIPCVIMNPKAKNKVFFSPELHRDMFTHLYSTSYAANKAHSKANFLKFHEIFGLNCISHVKKENLDDLADSFMQIMAYLQNKNCNLVIS